MAANPHRKISPGQVLTGIPAQAYNGWQDVAAAFREGRLNGLAGTSGDRLPFGSLVRIKNGTGAALAQFDVLQVSGVIYEPTDGSGASFREQRGLTGGTPSAYEEGHPPFVILQEPKKAGGIARAMIVGLTPCRISIADATHQFAEVKAGDCTKLESAETGRAQILWKSGNSGTVDALIYLHNVPPGADAGGGGGGIGGICSPFECIDEVDDLTNCDPCTDEGAAGWRLALSVSPFTGCGCTTDIDEYLTYDPDWSGAPTECRWVSTEHDTCTPPLLWDMLLTSSGATVRVLDNTTPGSPVVLQTWSTSRPFCCSCANTFYADCPPSLPPACDGHWPTSFCAFPTHRTIAVNCSVCTRMAYAYQITIPPFTSPCNDIVSGTFIVENVSENAGACYCFWDDKAGLVAVKNVVMRRLANNNQCSTTASYDQWELFGNIYVSSYNYRGTPTGCLDPIVFTPVAGDFCGINHGPASITAYPVL